MPFGLVKQEKLIKKLFTTEAIKKFDW